MTGWWLEPFWDNGTRPITVRPTAAFAVTATDRRRIGSSPIWADMHTAASVAV